VSNQRAIPKSSPEEVQVWLPQGQIKRGDRAAVKTGVIRARRIGRHTIR